MSDERVRVEIGDDGVAVARMVRADKHNALDEAMFRALQDAAARVASERGVRAVVLCGEGPSFCSGLDVASFMTGEGMGVDEILSREDGRIANFAQRASADWHDVPVPVIAAIHGNCFGGGLQIALGADIRLAAPDARLSIMEIKWGLIPDMAIMLTAPRVLPIDVAKELTFTGRIVSGLEAAELNLVTRVEADPLEAALALAREIASKSPDAIRRGKRLLDEGWAMSPADALVLESDLQGELLGSPNQMEAVRAGITKEPAAFSDPS